MPHQTTPAKVSTDITVITIVTAIGAAIGAFAILRPKLAISAAIKRETGSVEPAFRFLYVFPQYLNAILIALLFLALIATFVHSIDANIFAQNRFLIRLGGFFVRDNILWILFLGALIGAVVKINWLSWILLGLSRAASFLPISRLQGKYGVYGQKRRMAAGL
jgi:hypothetical protein